MSVFDRLIPLQTEGPLTSRLARRAGGFDLGQVPADRIPDQLTRSVCGFCSVGCALDVHLQAGIAVAITPSPDHPVNRGSACPKGWELLAPMEAGDRATAPMRRNAAGRLVPVTWPEAIDAFVSGIRAVQATHGPDSVAFLSTGQIPSEEIALLGLLARSGLGIRHGDGNTRQCMASAVVAYKQCFGFDAPPYTYADLERGDVIVFWGANPAIAHPILWERALRNPHHPAIVVVDPRRTETAMAATHHLPLRPKTDLDLAYAVGHILIRDGMVDQRFVEAHTSGFDDYAAHVRRFAPSVVARTCELEVERIEELAHLIGTGRAVSIWWTMGVNQSHQGVRTAQALIALALLTGNIGKPGTGANSITGQCNAMGSRLFANTASLFGGRDFGNPEHRAAVAEALSIDESVLPSEPSWPYDHIMEGIASGAIRGLWVIATNTAHSWINQSDARELLDRLDFLVVQDLYADTETAQHAHLVLPAAGWGEKEGTFINSERRLGLVKRVRQAPGQALADFWIFKAIAAAAGCADLVAPWTSPEAAFRLLQRLTAGMPCDITGVRGWEHVDTGAVQWPWPEGDERPRPGEIERRLFEDGRFHTTDGRARFVVGNPTPPPELPSPSHPLVLLTGRGSSAQWHTGTRTSRAPALRSLAPRGPVVEIHPDDAATRGLSSGDRVEVRSARGSMEATALLTPTMRRGEVFVPMHDASTNQLTFPVFDPHSRQPGYKHCAVEVRRR
ncbi:molybdopterin oxidoreductase family protein [Rhabdothermincola sp.]|uniref:molybdopterin oxidoreductase family protein n=1 Tax=Rhabdothermincola sp. TaxID=2820405 RepID=UPI002FE065CD